MKSFGTIAPSSNVMVERVTIAMTRDISNVSAHFARFGFAGSDDRMVDDYHWDPMLDAARLLADAQVDLICWNGSKGGELGLDHDRLLCKRIANETGIPAVTSVLALDELFKENSCDRLAFVSPFRQHVNDVIVKTWTGEGYDCVANIGAGLSDNYSYSTLAAESLKQMAREVARSKPQVIVFYCTNLPGAPLCLELEQELGIPVLDSVSAGVWKSLSRLGLSEGLSRNWGKLLR